MFVANLATTVSLIELLDSSAERRGEGTRLLP